MKEVLVSVIIPVYNAEKYLEQCLDSVLPQSLKELQVICVDDGSTDSSLDILRKYADRDNRLCVLRQQNQFAGAARNHGLKYAQGQYVAFLDADDYYADGDVLRDLVSQARKYHLDMLKGGFSFLNNENREIYDTPYSINSAIGGRWRKRVLKFCEMPQRLLQVSDVPWNAVYRRAFLEEKNIRFNNLRCVNDHSFYIHCLLLAERIMVTDRKIACYRVEQAGSLVGRKANYYACQLASHNIVEGLVQDAAPELRQLVMRQELSAALDCYCCLRPQTKDPEEMDRELREFLKDYPEESVGVKFLQTFHFSDVYYRMRYGTASPRKRPNAVNRLWNCWQEHGWYYTWNLMRSKLKGAGRE